MLTPTIFLELLFLINSVFLNIICPHLAAVEGVNTRRIFVTNNTVNFGKYTFD